MRVRRVVILCTVVAVAILIPSGLWVVSQPAVQAKRISRALATAELIGTHKYLDKAVLAEINQSIEQPQSQLPVYSHTYETAIPKRSIKDLLLCRQPICIEYTTHPIPPAYTGPITRHKVNFLIGFGGLREVDRSQNVLYEYFE